MASAESKKIRVFKSSADLSKDLAEFVVNAAADATAKRGAFTVALSGGSLPKLLAAGLVAPEIKSKIDWTKWFVFFADERVVPLDHADSNYRLCKETFFAHVPIPPQQIFPPDTSLPAEQCAEYYARTLIDCAPLGAEGSSTLPEFDLMFLGMGEDGHTASLFPNHPLTQETSKLVAPIFDSPKPPPTRVTLTLPVLNHSRTVAFVTTGAGKAPVLKKIFDSDTSPYSVPSKLITPFSGELYWFLDADAASAL
eukprot:CAMPEP_0184344256 /NCGR_PEP_ID=MMETSP1089-20130417/12767_1 /TAXON_ID=38269 ORGANISM="Gloeochaete wittrockiana, Strain SAG46.84" /NCGR_SAMPLE_ID=MMETSP1089 /ASSEMBLY_ACC=CAM_ASM_000445 /LENGTH=252 /DNA_ID=CAMNT_0026674009 /DNA_START=2247 /DNA_END=3005 /DNA_ORIENTATION=+